MQARHLMAIALLSLGVGACSDGAGSSAKQVPRQKSRASLVAAALDAKVPVKQRVAALVALQDREQVSASAKATVILRGHANPALATAAEALQRVARGRARIIGNKVAVVGASLSAGVGAKPLSVLVEMGLPAGSRVVNCADVLTYERPRSKTRAQLRKAFHAHADVVIALDTLFWFAYHNRSPEAKRAYLDQGLSALELVRVPLLLGDLPDMRSASPLLIPRANIPSPKLLAELNQRIRTWARKRLNVHVMPFSAWARPLLGKGRIKLVPGKPPIPAVDALLADGLHPNPKGTLYVLHRVFREIHRAFPRTAKDRFHTTPKLVELLMKM